jgi:hypothetical protein
VLDKKSIRSLMIGIFGVFSTVVPVLIAIYATAETATPVYGMMVNSSRVYACFEKPMTFDEGVTFCESIWMEPVSIHSTAENDALFELTGAENGVQFYVGATRCADTADRSPNYRWDDSSPWDFTNPGNDIVPTGYNMQAGYEDKYRMVIVAENSQKVWMDAGQAPHGIICAAPSLANVKGGSAIPTIRRLGGPKNMQYMGLVAAADGGSPQPIPPECPEK